ncbi:MAG: Tex family protein [Planctomycetota bacterium]
MLDVIEKIATELKLKNSQVASTVALLQDEATVPFIARYRKERTDGLDEVAIATIQDRLKYLTELKQRRAFILKAIAEIGKMTPELQAQIENAPTKAELEDLYMPYRQRRRTRSTAAKQKGLDGLAELIWKQETTSGRVDDMVQPFINAEMGVKDIADALSGARDIVAERITEDAACRKIARDLLISLGKVTTKAREGLDLSKSKFAIFAQFSEPITKIPSHRLLAALRGASEKQLSVVIEAPRDKTIEAMNARLAIREDSIFKPELLLAVEEAYDRLLAPSMDNEVRQELKQRADLTAIEVFARNLRALLLQSPLGGKAALAIDPGLRTGCKLAALDATGKLLAHAVIFPDKSADEKKSATETMIQMIKEHHLTAVAIGNGTGGREADIFTRDVLKNSDLTDIFCVFVNESGASIYSASTTAREEFPNHDVTVRGTVSIGRRLQDPLAELVKLDPKSIGVGQYQHDVDQGLLKQKLEEVVESCVNYVGVDVNTASADLLRYIAGIGPRLAKSVIETRNLKGAFKSRDELREIQGLGPKAFEQCAGFMRIRDAANPLDNSAIHPETYSLIESMAAALNVSVKELIGHEELISKIDLNQFKTEQFGDYTLKDILIELKKPGRDPRSSFVNPEFNEAICEVKDLKEGLVLNGIVTNLTAFGAFVDIGVHQDGLVHISAITHKFIRDPSEALAIGQHVKVKVLSVDLERKRISLSIKALHEPPPRQQAHDKSAGPRKLRAKAAPIVCEPKSNEAALNVVSATEGTKVPNERPRFSRQPRPSRTPHFGGNRFTKQPTATVEGQSAAIVDSATVTPGAPAADMTQQSQPSSKNAVAAPAEAPTVGASSLPERKKWAPRERHNKDAAPGKSSRRDDKHDRGSRPPAKPAAPGAPNYSKFFVKSKRREKEHKRVEAGASREEVREVMRKQQATGATLGDLLKKAGVIPDEDQR